MHIVEKDEQLDFYTFFNHGLPDDAGHGEYTKAVGQRTWDLLHGLSDNYGCHACKGDFQLLVNLDHDTINIKTGKGVYNPELYQEGVAYVNRYMDQWVAEGRPIHKDSPYSEMFQKRVIKQLNFSHEGLEH